MKKKVQREETSHWVMSADERRNTMKTEKIKDLIDSHRGLGMEKILDAADGELAVLIDGYAWEDAAKEKISALEAEIAAKDEAILDGISNTYMLKEHCLGVYQEAAVAVEDIEAALSPQTDKVLIDIEKLREIEWAEGEPGIARCPWCDRCEKSGHADDCWLAALLKEGRYEGAT